MWRWVLRVAGGAYDTYDVFWMIVHLLGNGQVVIRLEHGMVGVQESDYVEDGLDVVFDYCHDGIVFVELPSEYHGEDRVIPNMP
jgi:hypothetical protein